MVDKLYPDSLLKEMDYPLEELQQELDDLKSEIIENDRPIMLVEDNIVIGIYSKYYNPSLIYDSRQRNANYVNYWEGKRVKLGHSWH